MPAQLLPTPYWIAVGAKEAELTAQRPDFPDSIFTTSLPDPRGVGVAGRVVPCNRRIAACCIVNGTHRPSTLEEIADFFQQDRRRADEIRVSEETARQRRSGGVLVIDRESLRRLGEIDHGSKD